MSSLSVRSERMPIPATWADDLTKFVEEWKKNPDAPQYLGDTPFRNFIPTESTDSWSGFLAWTNELGGHWCFRGQREAHWSLSTSLDRSVKTALPNNNGYYHGDRHQQEARNIEKFRRDVRHAGNIPPDDAGSCFATMQHFGTPTRFLDWTESPFVAAYFAFEDEAREDARHSAIWAIDLDWLGQTSLELLPAWAKALAATVGEERAQLEDRLMSECHEPTIIRIHPRQGNERMVAQQGVLLCKLFHQAYFSGTLMRMMIHPQLPARPVLRKLEIPVSSRPEFLAEL